MVQVLLLLLILQSNLIFAGDKTKAYLDHYNDSVVLNDVDRNLLKQKEIILIPGIVSESFYWSDGRSVLDFAFLFQNYFGAQEKHYKKTGIPVTRLWASSKSVQETVDEIDRKMSDITSKNKKAIFVTHSLGGLALLDWLMNADNASRSSVEAIVFLQSPFYGSPVASVYFENPYLAKTILGPIMPFLNTSEETVKYLSVEESVKRMEKYQPRLAETLQNIKVITAGGQSQNSSSIFRPSLDIMAHGCVAFIMNECRSKIVYNGPYSDSDGMVPFEHSKILDKDFVILENVDHGETVLQMPWNNIDRVKMTDALVKMIL